MSLNSTFLYTQETLNGTIILAKQNIQTSSNFVNEEIVETIPTKTQQIIPPIHPTLTILHNKKIPFHKQNCNRHSNQPLFQKILKWIIKHIDQ